MTLFRKTLLALSLLGALASPAAALDPNEMFDDPVKEQRARDIGRQLRCLVCQNQSIFDSNAGLAHDLRVLVRDRMSAGDSDDQVMDYIYTRYGDYVLLEPRKSGKTLVLWLTPILALVFGLGVAVAYLRRRDPANDPSNPPKDQTRSAQAKLSATPDLTATTLTDADRAAAQKLLQGDKS